MYARSYALTRQVAGTVDEVEARVREALAAEGFGVLTHIDVAATMKLKLGVDQRPYRILGACNPGLAHQALTREPPIGLLLPCNVTVFEGEDGATWVQAIRPDAMFAVLDGVDVGPLAADVETRLTRMLEAVAG